MNLIDLHNFLISGRGHQRDEGRCRAICSIRGIDRVIVKQKHLRDMRGDLCLRRLSRKSRKAISKSHNRAGLEAHFAPAIDGSMSRKLFTTFDLLDRS